MGDTAARAAERILVADERTLARFFAKVSLPSVTGACWLWTGSRHGKGYGRFGLGRRPLYAHRVAYILALGSIPDGLFLDHLCRVPSCVNPSHLEPVTNHTNLMRGIGPSAKNAVKTHCHRGHPFDETNTGRQTRGRLCLTCKAEGHYR